MFASKHEYTNGVERECDKSLISSTIAYLPNIYKYNNTCKCVSVCKGTLLVTQVDI